MIFVNTPTACCSHTIALGTSAREELQTSAKEKPLNAWHNERVKELAERLGPPRPEGVPRKRPRGEREVVLNRLGDEKDSKRSLRNRKSAAFALSFPTYNVFWIVYNAFSLQFESFRHHHLPYSPPPAPAPHNRTRNECERKTCNLSQRKTAKCMAQ